MSFRLFSARLKYCTGCENPTSQNRLILVVLIFDRVRPTRKFKNKLLLFLPLTYLSRKTQACGHTTHGRGHQVVQVPVCRTAQLECPEADVIQSLVVNAVSFIGVLNQLMH